MVWHGGEVKPLSALTHPLDGMELEGRSS